MKKPRVFRDFKWEASNCRPVALKVSYFGANYHGFSSTNLDSVPTVEAFLFNALMTAKLIPASSECSWSKCGRTDKGVNAFSQVCSLYIRTVRPSIIKWTDIRSLEDYKHSLLHCTEEKHHLADYIATLNNHECDDIGEMDYVSLINKLLPEDIRVITWCPVDIRFDARFTCSYRTYDYHFSLSDSGSDLDIQAMQKGAHLFKGIHDFRNVAKIDTEKMEVLHSVNIRNQIGSRDLSFVLKYPTWRRTSTSILSPEERFSGTRYATWCLFCFSLERARNPSTLLMSCCNAKKGNLYI